MNHITIIPFGGLCNRMRAIASGIFLSRQYNCQAAILWNNSEGLKADFNDLFMPINTPDIRLTENKKWLYQIGNTKDYLIRYPMLHLGKSVIYNFDRYIDGDITPIIPKDSTRPLLLISCCSMSEHYSLNELFVPQPDIQKRIDDITSQYASYTIGVHIRRTDNAESIKRSPLEAFFRLLDIEVTNNDQVIFYLASDLSLIHI